MTPEELRERIRLAEAAEAWDRMSRVSGLKFESERQKATSQFASGVRDALTGGIDQLRNRGQKEDASLETSSQTAELTPEEVALLSEFRQRPEGLSPGLGIPDAEAPDVPLETPPRIDDRAPAKHLDIPN